MSNSIIVVGAGPIGLLSAFELARKGCAVTVLDQSSIGSGGSRWNAGEVVPLEVDPVSSLQFLGKGARGLLAPRLEPSLTVGLRDLLGDPGFFARFSWHARPAAYRRGLKTLVDFARPTFELLSSYQHSGVETSVQGTRFLYIFGSEAAAAIARRAAIERSNSTGLQQPGPVLGRAELHEFEPGLSDKAGAGYFQLGNKYIDSNAFVDSLIAALRAAGVRFIEHADITRMDEVDGAVQVHTRERSYVASQAVIAAGAASGELAARFGAKLHLRAGRGYSVRARVPLAHRDTLLHFSESHVVASPFDTEVQLAGQMNLAAKPAPADLFHTRILSKAAEFLPAVAESQVTRTGSGIRPLTPDGLPYIGSLTPRVHVATGHNMIGLTLAPATAAAVADLVLGTQAHPNLAPFSPHRFTSGD